MHAAIRVTSQLANPLLVRAATPYFPFTNRQVAKSGIAQYLRKGGTISTGNQTVTVTPACSIRGEGSGLPDTESEAGYMMTMAG